MLRFSGLPFQLREGRVRGQSNGQHISEILVCTFDAKPKVVVDTQLWSRESSQNVARLGIFCKERS